MKITAELKLWERKDYGPYLIYWGDCHGDIKGRFRDGAFIHTSIVKKEVDCGDHIMVVTLNSVYKCMKDTELKSVFAAKGYSDAAYV